jgi:hypothetical protein
MAGEVTGSFLLPTTFFSALPVLILFAVLGYGVTFLKGNAQILVAPVMFIAYVAVVGRFALAARQGEFAGGFFGGDGSEGLPGFVGRYLVLTLAWSIPLGLIVYLALDRETLFFAMMALFPTDVMLPGGGRLQSIGPTPFEMMQGGAAVLLLPVVALAALLMPTLSLVVATRADTLSEALGRECWGWLLSDRRADLPVFYAALIGGMVVFLGVYLLPFAFIVFFSFKLSLQMGVGVSSFLYLLGIAATPILLGRMCGAFVAGEGGLDAEGEDALAHESAPPVYYRAEPPVASEPPPVIEKKPGFDEILAKVRAVPADGLAGEIAKAEGKLAARPRDPHTAAELSLLYKKSGAGDKALKMAAQAITLAVSDGFSEIGVMLFRGYAKERAALGLNAQTLEIVGNILLKQGAVLDAGWCLHESASLGGDAVKAQKKLLHVASVAEESGKLAEAVSLYDFFIAKYPDSPLVQFARQGKERVQAARP